MSDVTQNRFDKYFSGSELVVAGKVQPSESNKLVSFTTASSVSLTMRIRDIYSLRYLPTTMSLLVTIVRECCFAPPCPAGSDGCQPGDGGGHIRAGRGVGQAPTLVHRLRQTNVGLHHYQANDL